MAYTRASHFDAPADTLSGFGQVWGIGALSIVDELASPRIRVSYPLLPAAVEGIPAFKQVLTAVHAALAGLEIDLGDPIAEGDRVAVGGRCAARTRAT